MVVTYSTGRIEGTQRHGITAARVLAHAHKWRAAWTEAAWTPAEFNVIFLSSEFHCHLKRTNLMTIHVDRKVIQLHPEQGSSIPPVAPVAAANAKELLAVGCDSSGTLPTELQQRPNELRRFSWPSFCAVLLLSMHDNAGVPSTAKKPNFCK